MVIKWELSYFLSWILGVISLFFMWLLVPSWLRSCILAWSLSCDIGIKSKENRLKFLLFFRKDTLLNTSWNWWQSKIRLAVIGERWDLGFPWLIFVLRSCSVSTGSSIKWWIHMIRSVTSSEITLIDILSIPCYLILVWRLKLKHLY